MMQSSEIVRNYLRDKKKFPTVWCPGCGLGIIMAAIIRAIDKMGMKKDEIVMVSGIGCTGRMPTYVDFDTLHTLHGRAIAVATGVKLAKPSLNVITILGDGDGVAIGGNHFIHAARRNLGLKAILVNNFIYGMTGGQASPTTLPNAITTTTPYGMLEPPFDVCDLAIGSGASFVARGTVYHALQLDNLIIQSFKNPGFSLVEVMSNCHVQFGRRNEMAKATQMIEWIKEKSILIGQWNKMTDEEKKQAKKENKYPIGILKNEITLEEYSSRYEKFKQQLKERN